MSGRVVHFEIPFDDGTRARRFYAEAFGWDCAEWPGMDYTMVTTGPGESGAPSEPGFVNGGMVARSQTVDAPAITIDVEDIDAALERVEALGGTTVEAKQPVADMGFAAYFRDSEGNLMGLWQSPPAPTP
jgi:hypothetical protein